jgi:hypothetical protein
MNTEQGLVEAWRALADTLESPGFDRRSYIERLNTLADVNGYDRTASLTEMVRAIVEDYGLRAVQRLQTTSPEVRSAAYLQGKIDGLAYLTRLAKKDLRAPKAAEPEPTAIGSLRQVLANLGAHCWTASCLERLIESHYSGVVAARPCTSVWRAACQAGDPTARRLGHSCLHCCTRPSVFCGLDMRLDIPPINPAVRAEFWRLVVEQLATRPCDEYGRSNCWTVAPKWLNTPWIQTYCFASCGGLWPSPDAKACRSKASDYARTCTSADRKYTIMPGCGHLCT